VSLSGHLPGRLMPQEDAVIILITWRITPTNIPGHICDKVLTRLKEIKMTKTERMIGAGLGVAAVAALGAYFLYGKNGDRNRQKVTGWMLKLKGEVLEKVEEIKDLNEQEYYKIVDEISARYAKLEKVGAEELNHLSAELKDAWKHLSGQEKREPADCCGHKSE